jgi:hypothetical protein
MKALKLVMVLFILTFCCLSFFAPRIPPLFSYFFCRSAIDWLKLDPCRMKDTNIPEFRGNVTLNIIRVIGVLTTFVTYGSGLWNAAIVVVYEVFPSIQFQKNCLRQFQVEVSHCRFAYHSRIIHKYRQLQVLNIMFNDIYKRDYFALCMASGLLVAIPSGYFLLTVHNITPLLLVGGVYITVMAYIMAVVMFSMASKVWTQSEEFVSCWRRNDDLGRKALTRKYGKSLQNLKVKIGSTNFVEQNTPFVFFSFCVEQTVSLVLMQKSN